MRHPPKPGRPARRQTSYPGGRTNGRGWRSVGADARGHARGSAASDRRHVGGPAGRVRRSRVDIPPEDRWPRPTRSTARAADQATAAGPWVEPAAARRRAVRCRRRTDADPARGVPVGAGGTRVPGDRWRRQLAVVLDAPIGVAGRPAGRVTRAESRWTGGRAPVRPTGAAGWRSRSTSRRRTGVGRRGRRRSEPPGRCGRRCRRTGGRAGAPLTGGSGRRRGRYRRSPGRDVRRLPSTRDPPSTAPACGSGSTRRSPRSCPASAPGWPASTDALAPVADAIEEFVLGGGKRLRPAFAYWGFRGAGGVDADQVVDRPGGAGVGPGQRADPRRPDGPLGHPARRAGGAPTVRHPAPGGRLGTATRTASATRAAILLGDLCLVWSDELLHSAGPGPARRWPGPGRSSTRCAPRSPSGSTSTC